MLLANRIASCLSLLDQHKERKKVHFARGFPGHLLTTRVVKMWCSEFCLWLCKEFADSVPVLSSPSLFLDENTGQEE